MCPAGPGVPAVRQKKPGYLLRMKVTWERRRCCLFLGFWSKADSTQPPRPAAAGLTPAAARWSLWPVRGTALSPRAQHRLGRGQRASPRSLGFSTQGQLRAAPQSKVHAALKPGSLGPWRRCRVLSVSGMGHHKESLVSTPSRPRTFAF